eukprot:353414-Chlamydomonas_euryale.AAC.18
MQHDWSFARSGFCAASRGRSAALHLQRNGRGKEFRRRANKRGCSCAQACLHTCFTEGAMEDRWQTCGTVWSAATVSLRRGNHGLQIAGSTAVLA